MKLTAHCLLIVALVALPCVVSAGDTDSQTLEERTLGEDFSKDFAGGIELGGWGADVEGSPNKVAEYEPADGGPALNFVVDSHNDWGSLLVGFDYNQRDDSTGKLNFDMGRMVRSHNTYSKFVHRDPHDQMKNLEATSTNGKVVWHTDLSPNAEYGVTYQNFHSRNEFQFDGLSAVTLGFEYRDQRRDGHKQAYTTSHCDNCHMYSQDHAMDERTRDAKLDLTYGWQGGKLTASWNHRTLKYQQNSVMVQYDDALHPELQAPVFDNRLQYDSEVGPVPADFWPNQEKTTGRLDLALNNVGGFVVNIGGVVQDSKNSYTGYRSDYKGGMLSAARVIGKKARLRWNVKAYSIDNDSVWVDTIERPSIAGPHAGQTYEDVYGINFDHWRLSALNRDVFDSNLELSWKPSKTVGTFRFRWDYESIDREFYEVTPGSGKTTENLLGIYWRKRMGKSFKLQAHLKHAMIDNPYMLVNGACSTLVSPQYPNPWSPETPQYHDQHDTRVADTTASAASWDEAKLGFTWMIGNKTNLTASYKYWDGDNSDGDLTDWSRTNSMLTATLWSAPSKTFSWHLGLAQTDSELNAPLCIPVFDG